MCAAVGGSPALVYNSDSLNVAPVIAVSLQTDPTAPLPTSIKARLTWDNGTPESWVSFSTNGHNPGDSYALDLQVSGSDAPVTSTGVYPWKVDVQVQYPNNANNPYTPSVTGIAQVVANGNSSFGAGWSLATLDSLLNVPAAAGVPAGVLWVYGSGQSRFFRSLGNGQYQSPANDFGTLSQTGTTYTYVAKDQTTWTFNSAGQLQSVLDPHGLGPAYSYNPDGTLATVQEPDGGVATFSYGGQLTGISEPGGRSLTLTYTLNSTSGFSDLTGLTNPDGGQQTFGYDAKDRLTSQQWGPLAGTYAYDPASGTLQTMTLASGSQEVERPAAVWGLTAGVAPSGPPRAVLTDALSQVTTLTLDKLGQPLVQTTPDGATVSWQRDQHGQATVVTDALGHPTTYSYQYGSGLGDLTQVSFPDGSTNQYQYDPKFHHETVFVDGNGNRTTTTYDTTTGDMLTQTNALNQTTAYTYQSGLLQSVTDPLNHTTTNVWDVTTRRLQATVDALGERTSYGYDAAGNQTTVTDALGRVTTTTYDAMRRVLTVTAADGGVTTTAYDAAGDVTQETDPLGHVTSYAYDSRGLQTAVTEAVGTPQQRTTTTAYDKLMRVLSTTNADNETTSYGYDPVGRQTQLIEGYGSNVQRTSSTAYDLNGNVLYTTDALGRVTSYAYDTMNRQTEVIEAYGTSVQRTSTMIYDLAGNLLSETTGQSSNSAYAHPATTSYAYDALNRVVQTIEAYGTSIQRTSSTAFDAAGNTLYTTDALGRVTSYAYDPLNRQSQVVEAYGTSVQRTSTMIYDLVGNLLSETTGIASSNAQLSTTSYGYDPVNRQSQVIDAYGTAVQRTSTMIYDLGGNLLSETTGQSATATYAHLTTTSYGYDALNRQVAVIEAYGTSLQRTTTTVLDAVDNAVAQIDPAGFRTTTTYDALNQAVAEQDPMSGVATTSYDAVGNVTAQTDQLGHTTSFAFDALNRQTTVTDALNHVTTYNYDAADNRVNVIDPDGNKTTFVFDTLNRNVQQIDPLNNSTTFAFDAGDEMTSTTDALGRVRNVSYDGLGRETGETWVVSGSTSNVQTFTYDSQGNQLTAADYNGAYTMTYNALNQMVTQAGPWNVTLTLAYDAAGNRVSRQDSLGGVLTSVYDTLSRLSSRQLGGTVQAPVRVDLAYTSRDQISTLTRYGDLGGTQVVGTTVYGYDNNNRVTSIVNQSAGAATLSYYDMGYDSASRLTTQVYWSQVGTVAYSGTVTYGYDTTNQLTSDGVHTYSYDANGNRTMTGDQTGGNNQLSTDGTWTYTYDKAGNETEKSKGPGLETWYFGYDAKNRLVTVEQTSNGTAVLFNVTYTYDTFGNRIAQSEYTSSSGLTTVTRFAYDGQNVMADLSGSNALLARYVYGDGTDQILARVVSSGQPNAGVGWYLTDWLGSVRDVLSAGGAVLDHLDYDGYGNVVTESTPSVSDRYGFTGRERDPKTGLQYNRERYYDPATGRWVSEDPLQFQAGDVNVYRYVSNHPTDAVDPQGTDIYFLVARKGSTVAFLFGHAALLIGPDALGRYFYYSFSSGKNPTSTLDNIGWAVFPNIQGFTRSKDKKYTRYTQFLYFQTTGLDLGIGINCQAIREMNKAVMKPYKWLTQNCGIVALDTIMEVLRLPLTQHKFPKDDWADPDNRALATYWGYRGPDGQLPLNVPTYTGWHLVWK